MSTGHWETTIGLEVHVQLATSTKLFCRCATSFGDAPNTHVCPVCLGHPGVLPVPSEEALAQAARAALLLGMTVQRESKFDRKNYFYPDLPKGYQISQFDEPLGTTGTIELQDGRAVRIQRLHVEEDAGKAVHDRGDFGLVDYNRAGTPLAEIVSEPDLRSATEARDYLEQLRERMRWAGVGDCDMEKGNLRVDVNVSLAPPGERATGTRTEIKNLNSFAAVEKALEHEIARHAEVLDGGGSIAQETRGWDEERERTFLMRSKEEAEDYRYFPDPDLPRLVLDAKWIEGLRDALPESAATRRQRYAQDLGLSAYDAGVLTAERELSDYFEATLAAGLAPKTAANWIANQLLRRVESGAPLASAGIAPERLAEAVALVESKKTNRNGALAMLDAWSAGSSAPAAELLVTLGLAVEVDSGAIEAACQEAIEALPAAADDVRNGKEKALGALLGHVMKSTRGQADPQLARETLQRLLGGDR